MRNRAVMTKRGVGLLAGIGMALGLTVADTAWAQKAPPGGETPPAPPAAAAGPSKGGGPASTFLADAVEMCAVAAVDGLDSANDIMAGDTSWAVDYIGENGPYMYELSSTKTYSDEQYGYYYAVVETYPTASVGYCSYEVDQPGAVDLNDVTNEYQIIGEVQTVGDTTYGTWDEYNSELDQVFYATGYVTPDLFHFQVTWIIQNN